MRVSDGILTVKIDDKEYKEYVENNPYSKKFAISSFLRRLAFELMKELSIEEYTDKISVDFMKGNNADNL